MPLPYKNILRFLEGSHRRNMFLWYPKDTRTMVKEMLQFKGKVAEKSVLSKTYKLLYEQ